MSDRMAEGLQDGMLERLPDRMSVRNVRQECGIKCIKLSIRKSEYMSDAVNMSDKLPGRNVRQECRIGMMPDKMSESRSDRMSAYISNKMLVECQIKCKNMVKIYASLGAPQRKVNLCFPLSDEGLQTLCQLLLHRPRPVTPDVDLMASSRALRGAQDAELPGYARPRLYTTEHDMSIGFCQSRCQLVTSNMYLYVRAGVRTDVRRCVLVYWPGQMRDYMLREFFSDQM